eukprot:PhF_6_TR36315/c0_g1_i1/m.53109/K04857/CACNA1S; voltage-dependent calcium channel L type alpha-1S
MDAHVNRKASSLFVFSGTNPIRNVAIITITNQYFQAFILVAIVLNSVCLALDQPGDDGETLRKFLDIAEYVFTITFTVEMVLKVVALGFILHKHAYLRNGWNVLDFVIVVVSLVALAGPSLQSLSTLRLFRVLRPLRSVNNVPQLMHLVTCLFRSLPLVMDNVLLMFFLLIIFAIGGVQLWAGNLQQRCFVEQITNESFLSSMYLNWTNTTLNVSTYRSSFPVLYDDDPLLCGGTHQCSISPFASNTYDVECNIHMNVYEDRFLNYDYIWNAMLLTFKVMSLDDWSDDSENAMNSGGAYAALYFVLLTSLGGYFCINLFLAILTKEYTDTVKKIEQEQIQRRQSRAAQLLENPLAPIENDESSEAPEEQPPPPRIYDSDEDTIDEVISNNPSDPGVGVNIVIDESKLPAEQDAPGTIKSNKEGDEPNTPLTASFLKNLILPKDDMKSKGSSADEFLGFGDFAPTATQQVETTNDDYMYPVVEETHVVSPTLFPGMEDYASGHGSRVFSSNPSFRRQTTLRMGFGDEAEGGPQENTEEPINMNGDEAEYKEPEGPDTKMVMMMMLNSDDGGFGEVKFDGEQLSSNPIRKFFQSMVQHHVYEKVIMTFTVFSVVCLSIDHYNIDPELDRSLDIINIIFTAIFACDVLSKIVAYGWVCFKDKFTIADALIVVAAIPDIFFSTSTGLVAFRAFRLIRVFRLARRWVSLQILLRMLLSAMKSALYLSILVFLFLYIFTILGMQLFGDGFPDEARTRFSNIWESAITCFVILTGDSWCRTMKYAMNINPYIGAVYFLVLYGIGNYILINLFIAIVLDTLDDETKKIEEAQKAAEAVLAPTLPQRKSTVDPSRPPALVASVVAAQDANQSTFVAPDELFLQPPQSEVDPNSTSNPSSPVTPNPFRDIPSCTSTSTQGFGAAGNLGTSTTSIANLAASQTDLGRSRRRSIRDLNHLKQAQQMIEASQSKELGFGSIRDSLKMFMKTNTVIPRGRSLGFLPPKHPVRRFCVRVVNHPITDIFVLFWTFVSSVLVGAEVSGVPPDVQIAFDIINIFVTIVFVIECLFKIVAMGAWKRYHRDHVPYFKDTFNCVDFFVTVISVLSQFIGFLRMLLVIRIVRIAMRFDNLRVVIIALVKALPFVVRGMCLALFVFLIFGILGVQLFKGEYYHCNDETIGTEADCVGTFTVNTTNDVIFVTTTTFQRKWVQETINFDNIAFAMFALFQITVSDGWSKTMYRGMDTTESGVGPIMNATPAAAVYFIVFFIFGNFFVLNIILGLLINYFTQLKKEHEGFGLLTKNQRDYLACKKIIDAGMFQVVPVCPTNPFLRFCFRMVMGFQNTETEEELSDEKKVIPTFEKIITLSIIGNAVILGIYHYNMDDDTANILFIFNIVFTIIFGLEAVIKLLAFGPRMYFEDNWNKFDFFVVLATIIGQFIGLGSSASVVRLLRVGRLLRLIRRAKGLNKLFMTLVEALPAVMNVMFLLLATFYVFAVVGVSLFKNVVIQGSLTNNANFQSVPSAMYLLYMIATTDGWADVMNACSVQEPDCSEALGNCGTPYAPIYFTFFMLCGSFVMIQLLIAIVVDTFTSVEEGSKHDEIVQGFMELRRLWSTTFGSRTTRIPCNVFFDFMPLIPRVLTGFSSPTPPGQDRLITLYSCMIPVTKDIQVQYRDVVYGLAFKVFDIDYEKSILLAKFDGPKIKPGVFTASHVYAAHILGKWWKDRTKHRQEERETSRAV